jgi:hypothetical protein
MATTKTTNAKTPAKAIVKSPAKAVVKTATKAAAEPSLRFFHSQELRAKTEAVLGALDAKPKGAGHADSLADLVAELVEAGMDYYFLRALTLAEVGFITEKSARLGMSGAVKLINSVSRKFIARMDAAQLQVVAQHIRSLA